MTVSHLTNGVGYHFYLWAENAYDFGNPAISQTPVAPRTIPGAARIGTPRAGNGAVTVWFAAPLSNGGAPITANYVRIYRGATFVKTVAAAAKATSLTVTGLPNGVAYNFAVAAANAAGVGPQSAHSIAVVPRTVPGAPRSVSAAAAVRAATVRWAAPASNGGSAITGYYIRVYRGSTLAKTIWVRPTTSAVVSGLTSRVGYRFSVAAINAAGTGPGSALTGTVTAR